MRRIQLIIVTLVLTVVASSIGAAQEPKGLNDLVQLNVRKAKVGEVLAKIAVQSDISIGFEIRTGWTELNSNYWWSS